MKESQLLAAKRSEKNGNWAAGAVDWRLFVLTAWRPEAPYLAEKAVFLRLRSALCAGRKRSLPSVKISVRCHGSESAQRLGLELLKGCGMIRRFEKAPAYRHSLREPDALLIASNALLKISDVIAMECACCQNNLGSLVVVALSRSNALQSCDTVGEPF